MSLVGAKIDVTKGIVGITVAIVFIILVIASLAPNAARDIGEEMKDALWLIIGAFICLMFGAFSLAYSKQNGGIPILQFVGVCLLLGMLGFIFFALKSFSDAIHIGAKGLGF